MIKQNHLRGWFLTGHAACLPWEEHVRKQACAEQVILDFTALNAILCQVFVTQPPIKAQILTVSDARRPPTTPWEVAATEQTVCFSWQSYKVIPRRMGLL